MATRAIRTRPEGTLAAVFGRIDHIGVAVADLESAIELHTRAYGMPLVHRETIAEQGVEAVLLDVGESHVELLRPLREETPVGRFLAEQGPGPASRRLPGGRTSSAALRRGARGGTAADRRDAAHRHPGDAGRVPASRDGRRRPDRARPARGGTLSPNAVRRTAVGFQGGQVLSLRLSEEVLNSLRETLKEGKERWLEVEASDGAVLVDIGQVVYLRVESDEHRIGF